MLLVEERVCFIINFVVLRVCFIINFVVFVNFIISGYYGRCKLPHDLFIYFLVFRFFFFFFFFFFVYEFDKLQNNFFQENNNKNTTLNSTPVLQ